MLGGIDFKSLVAYVKGVLARAGITLGSLTVTGAVNTAATKGDVLAGNGTTLVRKAAGTNGLNLSANTAQTDGLDYLPPSRLTRGRCTLTSGTPITTSDVTAAATLYWTPHQGDTVYIYDGAGWIPYTCAEMSIALDSNAGHSGYHQSGKNFDVFAFNDAGTRRIGTGPAWSTDTARGAGAGTTELELKNGIQTNKVSITLRFGSAVGNTVVVGANQATYLGTFRATADGQTEDSAKKRFVFNNYNRADRTLRNATETADTWTYTTATWRQANNNTANKVELLLGLAEDRVRANVNVGSSNNTAGGGVLMAAGIGLDATNAFAADSNPTITSNSGVSIPVVPHHPSYSGFPGLGYHFLAWLEYSVATGVTTWYGDNGAPTVTQSGMYGEMKA